MTPTTTSKALYVYLQRPDTGEWVTVGRYSPGALPKTGQFRYAPSYLSQEPQWAIDPVNLPITSAAMSKEFAAPRYGGLHDVLRDACPDAWGQLLLQKEHNLPEGTEVRRFLGLADNSDRWGALGFGAGKKPPEATLNSPTLPQLSEVVRELTAMTERKAAINPRLRRRLMQTLSVGGARPKATVRDDEGCYWLVKPLTKSDVVDIPCLEHFSQEWGMKANLNFAKTVLHPATGVNGTSAVRVLRFDRADGRRRMCVSAASLLQAEYPGGPAKDDRWSYARLAEELTRVGAPVEDSIELFGRMVFNAMSGNDDDHVRNHAIVYWHEEKRWRLAPAFDVVPNSTETPKQLAMQLSTGRKDISRDAILADAFRFGFKSDEEADEYLDGLLLRIVRGFDQVEDCLDNELKHMLRMRMLDNFALLAGKPYVPGTGLIGERVQTVKYPSYDKLR